MKCKLMHKNIPVASVEFDEVTGVFTKIYEVINSAHLPVGVSVVNGIADRRELHAWWMARVSDLTYRISIGYCPMNLILTGIA